MHGKDQLRVDLRCPTWLLQSVSFKSAMVAFSAKTEKGSFEFRPFHGPLHICTNHHSCKYLKGWWMCQLMTWFSGEHDGARLRARFDNLRSLFQWMILWIYKHDLSVNWDFAYDNSTLFQVFYIDSDNLIAINSLNQEWKEELITGIIDSVTNSKLLQKVCLSGKKVYSNECFLVQHVSGLLRKKKKERKKILNSTAAVLRTVVLAERCQKSFWCYFFPLKKNMAVVHLQKCHHFVVALWTDLLVMLSCFLLCSAELSKQHCA